MHFCNALKEIIIEIYLNASNISDVAKWRREASLSLCLLLHERSSYSSYVADYADAPTESRDSEINGCNLLN